MNMAGMVNGVSKLHGEVSKKMWASGFPDIPFDEQWRHIPVLHPFPNRPGTSSTQH